MRFDKCIQPGVPREPSFRSPALRGATGIEKVKEAGPASEILPARKAASRCRVDPSAVRDPTKFLRTERNTKWNTRTLTSSPK